MHACLAVVKSVSCADLHQSSFFMSFILSADCVKSIAVFLLSTAGSPYFFFFRKLRYLNLRYDFSIGGEKFGTYQEESNVPMGK